jgi:hypothetical protein
MVGKIQQKEEFITSHFVLHQKITSGRKKTKMEATYSSEEFHTTNTKHMFLTYWISASHGILLYITAAPRTSLELPM